MINNLKHIISLILRAALRLLTYAVLVVDVVDLVDSETLPVVQLLLLEYRRQGLIMRSLNDVLC